MSYGTTTDARRNRSASFTLGVPAGTPSDGAYIYMNPSGLTLFGAPSLEDIVGKRVLDLVPTEHREQVSARIAGVEAATALRTPLWKASIIRPDGCKVPVETTGTRIS